MDALKELLNKQYRLYMNRIRFISSQLRWKTKMPWER